MHGIEMPTTIKNRKGRKRKSTRREPNGKPQRASVDYRSMAALNPDRRGLPEALRTHERAGSELGRLSLKQRISDHEYEAGRRYAVIVGAYRATIGVPQGLSGGGKGYDCSPTLCGTLRRNERHLCTCRGREGRYDDAYCSIRTHAAHVAVNAVAIHDQAIPPYQIEHLRAGLAALARHFGLGRR
jgi:hypothetical protein